MGSSEGCHPSRIRMTSDKSGRIRMTSDKSGSRKLGTSYDFDWWADFHGCKRGIQRGTLAQNSSYSLP